jgi:predicted nucleic acid-binding protein
MDINRILRRCRTALGQNALPLRDTTDLDLFEETEVAGERVLLDTCVIIDQLQGRLPAEVEARILARTIIHSSIVLGEMSFLIGNLDPGHKETASAVGRIVSLLGAVPDHRIMPLLPEDLIRGNILSGCMARLLGYPKEARRKAQNDAILAAQASRLGCLLMNLPHQSSRFGPGRVVGVSVSGGLRR